MKLLLEILSHVEISVTVKYTDGYIVTIDIDCAVTWAFWATLYGSNELSID